MPYSNAALGLDEARLNAIVTLLQSYVSDLNTALSTISPTVSIPALTTDSIVLGDPQAAWDETVSGMVKICVVGGGEQNGQDFESSIFSNLTSGTFNTGWKYTFSTNIYTYLHPNALPNTDPFAQAAARERCRARIQDWLTLGVLNRQQNAAIPLGTNILVASPGQDVLQEAYVRQGYKGWIFKNFGASEGYYVGHYLHKGWVA